MLISPENSYTLVETCLDRINSLKDEEANEASTRLQLVDDILLALGWAKNEFNPEANTGISNYTDSKHTTVRRSLLKSFYDK